MFQISADGFISKKETKDHDNLSRNSRGTALRIEHQKNRVKMFVDTSVKIHRDPVPVAKPVHHIPGGSMNKYPESDERGNQNQKSVIIGKNIKVEHLKNSASREKNNKQNVVIKPGQLHKSSSKSGSGERHHHKQKPIKATHSKESAKKLHINHPALHLLSKQKMKPIKSFSSHEYYTHVQKVVILTTASTKSITSENTTLISSTDQTTVSKFETSPTGRITVTSKDVITTINDPNFFSGGTTTPSPDSEGNTTEPFLEVSSTSTQGETILQKKQAFDLNTCFYTLKIGGFQTLQI